MDSHLQALYEACEARFGWRDATPIVNEDGHLPPPRAIDLLSSQHCASPCGSRRLTASPEACTACPSDAEATPGRAICTQSVGSAKSDNGEAHGRESPLDHNNVAASSPEAGQGSLRRASHESNATRASGQSDTTASDEFFDCESLSSGARSSLGAAQRPSLSPLVVGHPLDISRASGAVSSRGDTSPVLQSPAGFITQRSAVRSRRMAGQRPALPFGLAGMLSPSPCASVAPRGDTDSGDDASHTDTTQSPTSQSGSDPATPLARQLGDEFARLSLGAAASPLEPESPIENLQTRLRSLELQDPSEAALDTSDVPVGTQVTFVDVMAMDSPASASTVTVVTPRSWASHGHGSPAGESGGAAPDLTPDQGPATSPDTPASVHSPAATPMGSPVTAAPRTASPSSSSCTSTPRAEAQQDRPRRQGQHHVVVDLCSPDATPSPPRTLRRKRVGKRCGVAPGPASATRHPRSHASPGDTSVDEAEDDDEAGDAIDILAIKQRYKTPRSTRRRREDTGATGSTRRPVVRRAGGGRCATPRGAPASAPASARRRRRAVIVDSSDEESGDGGSCCGQSEAHNSTGASSCGGGSDGGDSDGGGSDGGDSDGDVGSPGAGGSDQDADSDDMSGFIVNDSDASDVDGDRDADSDWQGSDSGSEPGGDDSDTSGCATSSADDSGGESVDVVRRRRRPRRDGRGAKPQARPVLPPRTPRAARTPSRVPASAGAKRGAGLRATPRQFKARRGELAAAAFREFNAAVFDGQLPAELAITWNARLRKTAGVTHMARNGQGQRMAKVELSGKVLDCEDRLRTTLLHELCHVAAWLIDGVSKPPHGRVFKKWAQRGTAEFPEHEVTTKHSYEIAYRFTYSCTHCSRSFGRHSKSVCLDSQRCGSCGGRLQLDPKRNKDGTAATPRTPSAFSLFVKENFVAVQRRMPPGSPAPKVLKRLAAQWKDVKAQRVGL